MATRGSATSMAAITRKGPRARGSVPATGVWAVNVMRSVAPRPPPRRRPAGARLRDRARDAFLHRGEDGHVGRRRELGDVVAVAEELDGAGEAGRGQLALVALAERPFAHELQHRVVAAAKDPEGAEEHRVVLHGL